MNGVNTVVPIWSFNSNISPYIYLVKIKYLLFYPRLHEKWGVNYWETYSSVFNCISVRYMIILRILRDFHTKSIKKLEYTTYGVNSEIFMELSI